MTVVSSLDEVFKVSGDLVLDLDVRSHGRLFVPDILAATLADGEDLEGARVAEDALVFLRQHLVLVELVLREVVLRKG